MATQPPPSGGNPPNPPGGRPPYPPQQPGQQPYGAPYNQPPYNQAPYGQGQVPYGANPKDYWRYQKEQNKAAWRAQRDTWKAQRDMMRAQSRANRVPSVSGPIVLIAVGIIALLLITGRINADMFWTALEKFWPMLLIGLGVVALAEWAIDLRRPNPPSRHYGGFAWLMVLIVFLALSGEGWHRWWEIGRAHV